MPGAGLEPALEGLLRPWPLPFGLPGQGRSQDLALTRLVPELPGRPGVDPSALGSLRSQTRRCRLARRPLAAAAPAERRAAGRADPARQPARLRGAGRALPVAGCWRSAGTCSRSKEDAEDVLQEVFAAAFNAMLADERPINVRPWLYRIARNRSLNHLRKRDGDRGGLDGRPPRPSTGCRRRTRCTSARSSGSC